MFGLVLPFLMRHGPLVRSLARSVWPGLGLARICAVRNCVYAAFNRPWSMAAEIAADAADAKVKGKTKTNFSSHSCDGRLILVALVPSRIFLSISISLSLSLFLSVLCVAFEIQFVRQIHKSIKN